MQMIKQIWTKIGVRSELFLSRDRTLCTKIKWNIVRSYLETNAFFLCYFMLGDY